MAVGPGTESESGMRGLILAEGSNEAVFRVFSLGFITG